MIEKAAAPQYEAAPSGTVLNVYRHRPGLDEPVAAFTPRSLAEHEHATLQVSVLLRDSIASVGWQTGGGKAAGRRLRGGQAYIVPSRQPHDFHLHRPQGMVNFHIDQDALVTLCPALLESTSHVLTEMAVIDHPVISGVATGLHSAAENTLELSPGYIDATWTMLGFHLGQIGRSQEDLDMAMRATLPARRLTRVLDYIDAHLAATNLRIADLASIAGLSPVHFSRLFAREMGASPMQFIIARRLDHARNLLLRGDASVTTIALESGFGSHSRFSESFRRHFGKTPTSVRYGRREKA